MELDRTPHTTVRIPCQQPYDWTATMAFLGARATPGVEQVSNDRYSRTISMGGRIGTLSVTPSRNKTGLIVDSSIVDPDLTAVITKRVRQMFDVDARPSILRQHFKDDPLLRRPLAAHPGIRTPGAWDAFEISVRAILGQQISVAAATTIAGRVAARWGTPIGAAPLARLFPAPEQIADAGLEEAGIIRARAATLRALARAVLDGSVRFDGVDTVSSLRTVPGIGAWTAQYIAMRALKDPDAFPSGDLVLRKMAHDCSARELDRLAERWRPWRAYAVMLLWQDAGDRRAAARN